MAAIVLSEECADSCVADMVPSRRWAPTGERKACSLPVVCVLVGIFYLVHVSRINQWWNYGTLRSEHDRGLGQPMGRLVWIHTASNALGKHGCQANDTSYERIFFLTVPRSGNTFSRMLLENLTGISTDSVYDVEGIFSNRSTSYGRPCGKTNDCDRIHRSSQGDMVIIKTHFPFMYPEFDERECVSKILMTIRHPVDNYLAWASFEGKGRIQSLTFRNSMNFKKYFQLWEAHHTYWHAFASRKKVPLLQYRYEDLCQQPEEVFRKVSAFLSVDFKGEYRHASKFRECTLRNRALTKAASILSQDDLDSLASRNSHLLDLFGYRQHLRVDTLLMDDTDTSLEVLHI